MNKYIDSSNKLSDKIYKQTINEYRQTNRQTLK